MRIAVITNNVFLYQKIRLSLLNRARVELSGSLSEALGADACFADISAVSADELASFGANNSESGARYADTQDSMGEGSTAAPSLPHIITVGKGGRLATPFTYEELYSVLDGAEGDAPELTLGERCAYLRGERIKLTEVEYALLSMLYEKKGEYVSREELRLGVWDEDTDSGVVNVYIHYLRQKLERGEKIINTSRSLGYKIDEKYIGGQAKKC